MKSVISSKVGLLTWHLLMFRVFLFHLSIILPVSLGVNMQRISGESSAFHLWLNDMLLHFNRKVWNFRKALASPNLICGHFLISFLEDVRILCGLPCTFSSRYFAYSWSILDLYWVWLLHPIQCPEFWKKYRNGQKWHLIRVCKQTKCPSFRKFSLESAPMPPISRIGPDTSEYELAVRTSQNAEVF